MNMEGVYRNLFAKQLVKEFTFIEITRIATEGSLLAVNENHLAVSWESTNGGVAIFKPNSFDRGSSYQKLIKGHKGKVVDIKLSPFFSDLLATCSEDGFVKLWKIPEEGIIEDMNNELQVFPEHKTKVNLANFNPMASDVIASVSIDGNIHVWNMQKGISYSQYQNKEVPISLNWNQNGSLLGETTRNGKFEIFDPRQKKTVFNFEKLHNSSKSPKFVWISNDNFISCGFGKNNINREFKQWDCRKIITEGGSSSPSNPEPVHSIIIDEQSGTPNPFYDYESKILYISGKGEGNIYAYDLNEVVPTKVHNYPSLEGAVSLAMVDRKAVNYKACEIDKFIKCTNGKCLSYISFYVFRREQEYDKILFPDIPNGKPSMSYDEWVSGENKEPTKVEITNLDHTYKGCDKDYFVKREVKVKELTLDEKMKIAEDKKITLKHGIEDLINKNKKLRDLIEKTKKEIVQIQEETKQILSECN